jgi:hypothetical protein
MTLVLTNAYLIDCVTPTSVPGASITVEEGRIVEVLGGSGIVNLFALTPSSGREVGEAYLTWPLGGPGRARDLLPHLESLGHDVALRGGGEPVARRSDVLGNGTIGGEEPLRMTR